jgi:hypothetical protein
MKSLQILRYNLASYLGLKTSYFGLLHNSKSEYLENKSISRILSFLGISLKSLIIYLDAPSPIRSIDLPTDIRRAALQLSAYLVFQHVRFTYALFVTKQAVVSYSTFSPLPNRDLAVIFCCTCCYQFVAKLIPSR